MRQRVLSSTGTRLLQRSSTAPLQHHQRRTFTSRLFPQPPPGPRGGKLRAASTQANNTDWLGWLKKGPLGGGSDAEPPRRALIFAGMGSYPHKPVSPTPSSMAVWEEASEALISPDATIGYWDDGMDEFAGAVLGGGGRGIRGWLRGWVEGRTLDELMARPDVTAAFILSSSIAILATEQERSGHSSLLPPGTQYLAGHGFIGTLTALVAAGRLDLATGVRLARIYATLPASPPNSPTGKKRFLTTALSARYYHSLSTPSHMVPYHDPLMCLHDEPETAARRRVMQLILDEVHGLQHEWEVEGNGEWCEAGIINSSRVLIVTGTHMAVEQLCARLQELTIANPVMDVNMPCPYHTKLMLHAVPKFADVLQRCSFKRPKEGSPIILDPITTRPMTGPPAAALVPQLTHQLRWHKTLARLHSQPSPPVDEFLTVGRGAKGLGIMLRGEIKKRPDNAPPIAVEEFGVANQAEPSRHSSRPSRPARPHNARL